MRGKKLPSSASWPIVANPRKYIGTTFRKGGVKTQWALLKKTITHSKKKTQQTSDTARSETAPRKVSDGANVVGGGEAAASRRLRNGCGRRPEKKGRGTPCSMRGSEQGLYPSEEKRKIKKPILVKSKPVRCPG